jgi:hypothetical protein
MLELVIESIEPRLEDYIEGFCQFVYEKLGVISPPTLIFVDRTGAASFGHYSPSQKSVTVATKGRHMADTLRTVCHEIIHHKQMELGLIETLSLFELEAEANAVAGLLLRDANKEHPEWYGVMDSVGINNDTDEHESFGARAADPTRPSGPIELAELTAIHERVRSGRPPGKPISVKKLPPRAFKIQTTKEVDIDPSYSGDDVKIHVPKRIKYKPTEYGMTTSEKAKKEAEEKETRAYDEYTLDHRFSHLKYHHAKNPGMVNEDAPVNAAGSGEIAGIGVGPQGEPGIKKSKMIHRKPKSGLATIFAGFPRKTLKEYKATIIKKLNWNDIEKDTAAFVKPLVKPKKNLRFLGMPHKSLKQFMKGK